MSRRGAIYPWGMRKPLTALCLTAGLGAGALAASGCGAAEGVEQAVGVDAAKAASTTASKGTARVTFSTRISGAGLPMPITLDGTGVTALGASRGTMTFKLGSLLALAGASPSSSGDLDLRFDGGKLWVKPPAIGSLKIPGGKHWVALDLPRIAAALGLPDKGLGGLFSLDPSAQLRALRSVKGLKEVGKEDVAGASTTHFHGSYRVSDTIKALPAAQRKTVGDALDALKRLSPDAQKQLDVPVPADLWVDASGVTRRLVSTVTLPSQGGRAGGTLREQYELSDFGTKLDVTAPPAGDTFEATQALTGVLGTVAKQLMP